MVDEALTYIETRLVQWGEWYSRGNLGGLGYPPCSVEYRLMMEGHIERNPGPRPLPVNEAAEEIENWVVVMTKDNFLAAEALRLYYCEQCNQRTGAKKMGTSPANFNHYVALGKHWLMGRLKVPVS